MRIIPALDLMNSKVVRLTQGKPYLKKEYFRDFLDVARMWKEQGAELLHIVDLDKALGKGNNFKAIKEIVKKVKIDIQVGGGIRTYSYAKKLLDLGVKRIILGTRAFRDNLFLNKLLSKFPSNLAVSIDIKNNKLALEGWKKTVFLDIFKLLKDLEDMGLEWLIYTDVSRDGTLKGLNYAGIKKIKEATSFNLIVSGGVSGLKDLEKAKKLGVWGVIIGKALYEGKLDFKEALKITG